MPSKVRDLFKVFTCNEYTNSLCNENQNDHVTWSYSMLLAMNERTSFKIMEHKFIE